MQIRLRQRCLFRDIDSRWIERHDISCCASLSGGVFALLSYDSDHGADIKIRQVKYLNKIIEQDHRALKRLVRPMLGFRDF
jgi:transposase-like protein